MEEMDKDENITFFKTYKELSEEVLNHIALKQGLKVFVLVLGNSDSTYYTFDIYVFDRLPKGLDCLIKDNQFTDVEISEWSSFEEAYQYALFYRNKAL